MDFGPEYAEAREIGRGGSSTVYRAHSIPFDRDVAVKVFHGGLDDERLRRDFARECAVLGRLGDHPHIVSLFGSGFTSDGRPYLAMTYCEGGALDPRRGALLPVEQVLAVGIAVADALHAAHGQGIVHRDVKPHNVLRDRYGVVLLADFGISARGPAELTSAAATPAYTAPEVLLDHRTASAASDVHGLGATLFALLTGEPPCPRTAHEPDLHYVRRIVNSAVPPLPASVPAPVAQVVLAALARDPAARPAAAALAGQLRRAAGLAGLTVPARLPTPGPPGPPGPLPVTPATAVPDGAAGVGTGADRGPDHRFRHGTVQSTDVDADGTFGADTRRPGGTPDGTPGGTPGDAGRGTGRARPLRAGLAAGVVALVAALAAWAGFALHGRGASTPTAAGAGPSSTGAPASAGTGAVPAGAGSTAAPSMVTGTPGAGDPGPAAPPGPGSTGSGSTARPHPSDTGTAAPGTRSASSVATRTAAPAPTTTYAWKSGTGSWSNGNGRCEVRVEWGYRADGGKVPYATTVSSTGELITSSIQFEHVDGSAGRTSILHWTGGPTLGFGPSRYSGAAWGNAQTSVEAKVFSAQQSCTVWLS